MLRVTIGRKSHIGKDLGQEVSNQQNLVLLVGTCAHDVSIQSVNCNRAGHTQLVLPMNGFKDRHVSNTVGKALPAESAGE